MKIQTKQSGAILIPTIIISGMLLALALTLTKIMSNELQFSADLLLAERSYFAAESGVEQSLLSLRDEPINWVDNFSTELLGPATTIIEVKNAKTEFSFSLLPKTTIRWRLGVDPDPEMTVAAELVREFQITGTNISDDLQWKIQCSVLASNGTEMLQSRATSNQMSGSDTGVWDNGTTTGTKTIHDFLAPMSDETLCFISLTNFGINDILGTVTTPENMAPAQTLVRAIGRAGGREKIIEFEYRQKNLNPFFDFGILHKN
jgi:hypothetical protein